METLFSARIPFLGVPKRDTRHAILEVLHSSKPITAKKVYYAIKSNGVGYTYQAVHKSLKQLLEEGVVTKSPEGYVLSREWISALHAFSESLYRKSMSPNKVSLKDLKEGESAVLEFDYIIAAPYWIVDEVYEELQRKRKFKQMVYHWYYFWPTSMGGDRFENIERIFGASKGGYFLVRNNSAMSHALAEYVLSSKAMHVKFNQNVSDMFDLVILDDVIFYVYWPREYYPTLKKIHALGAKNHSFAYKRFYAFVFKKIRPFKVVVTRNPSLADEFRKSAREHFKS